jgi:hypothetical protein
MYNNGRIIDAWMQHMTSNFIGHPMFESLRHRSHRRFGARDSGPCYQNGFP